jgi:hypothetical protein
MTLNVKCDACKKGNLVEIEMLDDEYIVGCDTCANEMFMHYTTFDSIQDESYYNDTVSADVKILNANGGFSVLDGMMCIPRTKFDFDAYTKNMRLIQKNEVYDIYYFQSGADFFMISYDDVDKVYDVCKYEAHPNGMQALIEYFFQTN